MAETLTGAERTDALAGLDGWREIDGRDAIEKTFRFADFAEELCPKVGDGAIRRRVWLA